MENNLIIKESNKKYLVLFGLGILGLGFYFYPTIFKALNQIYEWAIKIGPLWAWIAIIIVTLWFLYKYFID